MYDKIAISKGVYKLCPKSLKTIKLHNLLGLKRSLLALYTQDEKLLTLVTSLTWKFTLAIKTAR